MADSLLLLCLDIPMLLLNFVNDIYSDILSDYVFGAKKEPCHTDE